MIQNTDQLDNNNQPLVSIIVITYNSSKYVLETLESAKNQTYQNIELIISDDCSTDDTVEICEKWLIENQFRFKRTEIVVAKKNKGIAPNCNQGLSVSKGEWVKIIAGDDMLLDYCIEVNLELSKNSTNSFFFSQMRYTKENNILKNHFLSGCSTFQNPETALKSMLVKDCIAAPTSFIKREALNMVNGFDERFPMREDYPMWIKVLKMKYQITVSNIETVIYRNNEESVSKQGKANLDYILMSNLNYQRSKYKFERKVLIIELIKHFLWFRAFDHIINQIQFQIIILFKNKRNIFTSFFVNFWNLFKPSFYYRLLNTMNKKIMNN